MKTPALLILGTLLLAGCSTMPNLEQEAATKKLKSDLTELQRQRLGLQERVRRSDAENAQMREQLVALGKENEALKKRLAATTPAPSAGPPVAAPPAAQPQANKVANGQDATIAKTYMYLGQPRSRAWFEQMYMKFADKIVRVDGNYLDIGKLTGNAGVEGIGPVGPTPSGCKVKQVIGKDDVLIRRPGIRPHTKGGRGVQSLDGFAASVQESALSQPARPELTFHVKGVNTKGLVDGAEFFEPLVCIGTYSFVPVGGGSSTVWSYVVHRRLSEEQFADALAKGFELASN